MAHPFNDKRATKVQRERLSLYKAEGGSVHGDEVADKSLIKKMVKPAALRADGGAVKARADRPGRARGGPVKSKSRGTTVNVIVAPAGGAETPPLPPGPVAAPPAPPVMPPKPMMPPGMPPSAGLPPPGAGPMPPRSQGGRATYKRGGAVKNCGSCAAVGSTPIQHTDNMDLQKKDLNRKPVITKRKGGKVK